MKTTTYTTDFDINSAYSQLPGDLKLAVKTYIEMLLKNYKNDDKQNKSQKKDREFGIGKGIIEYMSPDFDEPLEDLKEYM